MRIELIDSVGPHSIIIRSVGNDGPTIHITNTEIDSFNEWESIKACVDNLIKIFQKFSE